MDIQKKLCELDSIIESVINDTNPTFLQKLPFSFNMPYYALCLNKTSQSHCADLSQSLYVFMSLQYQRSIDHFRIGDFRKQVVTCTTKDVNDSVCKTSMAHQVRDYILPRHASGNGFPNGTVHVAAILRVL